MHSTRLAENYLVRSFVVGCDRSGTTLLQSFLAAHPEAFSLPETHFFRQIYPCSEMRWFSPRIQNRLSPLRRLRVKLHEIGMGGRNHYPAIRQMLETLDREHLLFEVPKCCWTKRGQASCFIRTIDRLARDAESIIWIEKSPPHVHLVRRIQRLVPQSRIIHILRDGRDNVASLWHASQTYGGRWSYWYPTIDHCIRRWRATVRASRSFLEMPGNFHLRYDDLVLHPEQQLERICEFLGIGFCPQMISSRAEAMRSVASSFEVWKHRNSDDLAPKRRFEEVFSRDQQRLVESELAEDLDLSWVTAASDAGHASDRSSIRGDH